MEQIVIEGFPKNRTTVVVGLLNEFKGRVLAHVRQMKPAIDGDALVYGSGVTIAPDRLWELVDAVRLLRDVAALNRIVAKIDQGKHRILVGVHQWKGNQFAYIRLFFPEGDRWEPTSKGVDVRTAFVDDLVELVERLADAAVDADLLPARHDPEPSR